MGRGTFLYYSRSAVIRLIGMHNAEGGGGLRGIRALGEAEPLRERQSVHSPAMITLRTPRLALRPFTLTDAPTFAEDRSDPEIARYQSWTTPFSLTAAEKLIGEMLTRSLPRPGEWNQVAIAMSDDGTIIGDCAFQLFADDERQARIGFTLSRAFQGRGLATEAVRALVMHLLNGLGLHRVTAECDAENVASQRVLERIGMRREGHFVENVFFKGAWGSEYAYAILRSEWTR